MDHEYRRLRSIHVTMEDGVRIAIDVWLPESLEVGERVPALLNMTRYWRAQHVVGATSETPELDANFEMAQRVGAAGYAWVLVDARGTGASFGTRAYETTVEEVRDYGEIVDWIVTQPWSNGRVGAFGVSYEGTTSELLATNQREAVRAVAPLYPDWSAMRQLVFPGNVYLELLDGWGAAVDAMDNNDICALQGAVGEQCEAVKAKVRGVKPVDGDDGTLLRAAVEEHAGNVDVGAAATAMEYRDDPFGEAPASEIALAEPSARVAELESSGAAIFTRVGWLDAATVNGALSRFNTLSNPQRVEIGALSHGGGFDTDPFRPSDAPPDPSREDQFAGLFQFFDRFLEVGDDAAAEPLRSEVRYVTLGSGEWHTTKSWPPEGFEPRRWYLDADGSLSQEPPMGSGGHDRYVVDYSATTGPSTRWHTNLGGGDVVYPDRREADQKLVTWTSPPLVEAIEITGHPLVTLYLASDQTDGAVFVYLEVVAPDGRVTYVTEGQLRLSSRAVSAEQPTVAEYGPHRTFERTDAQPLVPGEVVELTFDLWATSVRVDAGSRLRIALAGADQNVFMDYPRSRTTADDPPVLTIERSSARASRIELPTRVVEAGS